MRKTHPAGVAACLLTMLLIFAVTGRPQSPSVYERAMADFRAGDYARAAELFAQADVGDPGATQALLLQAKCLVHLERHAEAEKALRRYAASHPNSDDALYLMGFVLYRQNKPAESLEMYTKGASLKSPTGDDLPVKQFKNVTLGESSCSLRMLPSVIVVLWSFHV